MGGRKGQNFDCAFVSLSICCSCLVGSVCFVRGAVCLFLCSFFKLFIIIIIMFVSLLLLLLLLLLLRRSSPSSSSWLHDKRLWKPAAAFRRAADVSC